MRLQLADWVFEIHMDATMQYSAAEAAEHCDCAYCRNFYAALDARYPDLRGVLGQFGADAEAPEELMPFDLDGEMVYDGVWAVCGWITRKGSAPLSFDDITVFPDPENHRHVNCFCPEPYFLLEISGLRLPWVLDEPMEQTVSPANLPSFLSRMWDKLLHGSERSRPS